MTPLYRESLRLESPAARTEMARLEQVQVGDIREGVFLPALDVGVEWVCATIKTERVGTSVADTTFREERRVYWEFEGTFFGQPLYRLVIRKDHALLTLTVERL